nr:ORF144 [Lymantria dispar multiple nucleopolyhedrovirus]WAK98641.1 ORF144 [Lymantria dispar multiple nucleopolyhedrovirus]
MAAHYSSKYIKMIHDDGTSATYCPDCAKRHFYLSNMKFELHSKHQLVPRKSETVLKQQRRLLCYVCKKELIVYMDWAACAECAEFCNDIQSHVLQNEDKDIFDEKDFVQDDNL